ncbi:unnamed protein product [Mytilus edulis]|uniref:Endonuclease/exonuclease/phosphatase domain-containing protein n=1 Tax=Mytilus edulis TaxID=6550 RepID=A0A8S3U1Q5_MYTED|nr:unnamed protein product [Mytilus edulis]
MRIVNGRFLGDSLGYFTFYNSNGKSTVDYMLTSQNLFYTINNFMVKPPTDLSDHCLIALNIFNFKNSKEIDKEELWSLPGKFKWADQSKDIYIDALLEEKSVEDILSLNKLIDDNNFNDIDFLVNKTNEIYLEAAKKSVSFKANLKKSIMQRHTKKAKPKKVWMSNDCLLLRKEVRSLGNRLAKAPNNNALRLTYCNCKREYNKLKNKLKKDFFHSLIKQINEINPKNTKEFWGSINNYKKKNNNCEPAISAKEWEIHYKNLLASSNNDKTDTNQNIENKNQNFSNTSLNVPITCKEIKDCIKKLKKGKSGGPDLIINEFLKCRIILCKYLPHFVETTNKGRVMCK